MMKKLVLRTIFTLIATLLLCCGLASTAFAETEGGWEYRAERLYGSPKYMAIITGYNGTETDLVFPETLGDIEVAGIDDYAFQGNSHIKSITLPYYYDGVGKYAFEGCSALEEINYKDYYWTLNIGTFENCPALKKVSSYSMPYSVVDNSVKPSVYCSPFRNSGSSSGGFVYYYLGDNGATIENSTFKESFLKEIVFDGGSFGNIESEAFKNCKLLETISVGQKCTSVGKDAFKGCDSLKTVYYYSNSSKWKKISVKSGNQKFKDAKRYYRLQTPVLQVGNKPTYIIVSWEKVPNAKEYKIYRKVDGGEYKLAKTIKAPTAYYWDKIVKDNYGTKYVYKVVAVNGSRKSGFEEQTIMRMEKPTVKLKQIDDSIQITWNKIKGADGYLIDEDKFGSQGQIARIEDGDTLTFTQKLEYKGYGTINTYAVTPYYGYSDTDGIPSYSTLGITTSKDKRIYNNSSTPERVPNIISTYEPGLLPEGAVNRPVLNRSGSLNDVVATFVKDYAMQAGYSDAKYLFTDVSLVRVYKDPWADNEKLIRQSSFYDNSMIAQPIQHVDGRFGIQIRSWRSDYFLTFEDYNYLLDYFCYLSGGDEEVGFALWKWLDTNAMKGKANSKDFGFASAGKKKIKMNDVTIEYMRAPDNQGLYGGYYLFFDY